MNKNIDLSKSFFRKESVGTMVLELQKETRGIWKNLFKGNKKPKRLAMRIWWDMRDAFPEAMKEYRRLLDEEEDEEDAVSVNFGRFLPFFEL